MIAVLRDQHVRQKAGPGPAALDRPRRQGRLVEAFAAAAGQARPHDALHHEAAGDVLQFLGHILAQSLEMPAAVRAAFAWREDRLLARQMIRQGAAPGLLLRRRRWFGQRLGRLGDLLVLQGELELVESFRRGAEAPPAQTRKLMLELLDQQIAVAQLGVPRRQFGPGGQHHRLQCSDVVRQGMGFGEHGGSLPERVAEGKPESTQPVVKMP